MELTINLFLLFFEFVSYMYVKWNNTILAKLEISIVYLYPSPYAEDRLQLVSTLCWDKITMAMSSMDSPSKLLILDLRTNRLALL